MSFNQGVRVPVEQPTPQCRAVFPEGGQLGTGPGCARSARPAAVAAGGRQVAVPPGAAVPLAGRGGAGRGGAGRGGAGRGGDELGLGWGEGSLTRLRQKWGRHWNPWSILSKNFLSSADPPLLVFLPSVTLPSAIASTVPLSAPMYFTSPLCTLNFCCLYFTYSLMLFSSCLSTPPYFSASSPFLHQMISVLCWLSIKPAVCLTSDKAGR